MYESMRVKARTSYGRGCGRASGTGRLKASGTGRLNARKPAARIALPRIFSTRRKLDEVTGEREKEKEVGPSNSQRLYEHRACQFLPFHSGVWNDALIIAIVASASAMPSPSRVLLFLPLAYATLSTVEMGPRSFYLYDYLKRPAAAT